MGLTGEEKKDDEVNADGICLDCQSSILFNNDIPPNV